MPSKIAPNSVRFPPPLRSMVCAHAADQHGGSFQAAVLHLVILGLERVPTPLEPKEILAQAEAKAAHLGKPKPKRSRAKWVFKSVQLGPTVPPAGSRLKAAKKGKH